MKRARKSQDRRIQGLHLFTLAVWVAVLGLTDVRWMRTGGPAIEVTLEQLLREGEDQVHPSTRTGPVTVYAERDFRGAQAGFARSDPMLCDDPLEVANPAVTPCFSAASWNDVISSIEVRPGYRAVLYLDSGPDRHRYEQARAPVFGTSRSQASFDNMRYSNGAPVDENASGIVVQRCQVLTLADWIQVAWCVPIP